MRRWLARLGFSFIVIGLVLIWEIYNGTRDGTLRGTRLGLYYAGVVVCLGAGVAGMKERHRKDDVL